MITYISIEVDGCEGSMVEKQLGYKYQVYNEIKKGIMTGVYPPGFVMNERKLSEELGISRTPIREGMQMLARDGWLQMETYKGTVVREFDPHYMWELTRVRSALELSAIEDAVKNVTEKDLKCLEEIQENRRKSWNIMILRDLFSWIGNSYLYLPDEPEP